MTFLARLQSLFRSGSPDIQQNPTDDQSRTLEESKSALECDDLDVLPPLRPVTFPKILPFHQPALADQGWSTITYSDPDPLHIASQSLFAASQAFFDRPTEYKQTFKSSEKNDEGWNCVEGEKEFVTLRSTNIPDELREAACTFWNEAGGLLDAILGQIAQSLGLPAEAYTCYSAPCKTLGEKRTQTMMRLFRYEGYDGVESKIVAEGHRDVGLLSLVIGDTPGLEVLDRNANQWFQIENTYQKPAASLLVGRQLEMLSNGRYLSGGHLVRSYPTSNHKIRKYRYSIVFALRAHGPVCVDTEGLTTSITGEFKNPIRNSTASDMFRVIYKATFNVNIGVEKRK